MVMVSAEKTSGPVIHSAIYQGKLRHRRFFPKAHDFTYASTLFYIDLDELHELFNSASGWSLYKSNLGSFQREDFLGDPAIPLIDAVRTEVNEILLRSGNGNNSSVTTCPVGPVRMLTNLRIFGFCFNPVTLYYLFGKESEAPTMILAQVNNTPWNERHSYLIQCDKTTGKTKVGFEKKFHVSPFNPIAMNYRWISSVPADNLIVHMENFSPASESSAQTNSLACHMDATLSLKRIAWSAGTLQKILWFQPWLAIKVPFAIYWQALRLFIKGVPVHSHQAVESLAVDKKVSLSTGGKRS
jgi:uncharacterized protein